MKHVPLYMTLPFGLLLGCIALLPAAAGQFWEGNRNKALVAAALSAPVAFYLARTMPQLLHRSLTEYLTFMAVHGALYVAASGIHVAGDIEATPENNTLLLGTGCVLASVVGSLAASIILLRPFLEANGKRKYVQHLPLFFLLIVTNCGGMLSAVGSPPLLLGYLRGVPYQWSSDLIWFWFLVNAYLLTLFYFLERRAYSRERPEDILFDEAQTAPVQLFGLGNVLILAAILGSILLPRPFREIACVALALLSSKAIARDARELNRFNYRPLVEFTVIYLAVFVTMVPAIGVLGNVVALKPDTPRAFYLSTSALAALFGNVPAYLSAFDLAQHLQLPDDIAGIPAPILQAISLGAVLMGGVSYAASGPTMMVKALGEESGLAMPASLRYTVFAFATLAPIAGLLALLL